MGEAERQRERMREVRRRGRALKTRLVLPGDPMTFWGKLEKLEAGCWLYPRANRRHGYGEHQFYADGGALKYRAHRLAWMLTHGPVPAGKVVRHICDTPLCCNPAHLKLGTQAQNDRERDARGRTARGTHHGMAKLTPEAVMEIRRRVAAGETRAAVGTAFGVSRSTVGRVAQGKKWTHLPIIPTPARLPKTHCVHGHAYDLANTIWNHRGRRECRTCRDARNIRALDLSPLLNPEGT